MAISDSMIKRIARSTPSDFPDIIMDLIEDGYEEEAAILEKALDAYVKFNNIIRYGGSKDEREEYAALYYTYILDFTEKIISGYGDSDTLISSRVLKVLNRTLNETTRSINLTPSISMVKAAKRGLKLAEKYDQHSINRNVIKAHSIINNTYLGERAVRSMHRTMSKLEAKKGSKGWNRSDKEYPSKDYINWLLNGGQYSYNWLNRKVEALDKSKSLIERRKGKHKKSYTKEVPEPITYRLSKDFVLVSDMINGVPVQSVYRTDSIKDAVNKFKAKHLSYYKVKEG